MPFDPNFGISTDDELLALGRQAGYIPSEDTIAPAVDPAMAGGLTPPDMEMQSPQATPTLPGSFGITQSARGFSPGKYGQVSRTDRDLNRDYEQVDQHVTGTVQRDMEAATLGREGSINAAQAGAEAQVNKVKATGEQSLVMQRLQDGFAAEEAGINAQANALSNQAKADYLAALADFRGSQVNPAQLWGNMGGAEKVGMIATAFVHDFLGAKGINTSAMATFNKAIDRNIDAQIQAIKTKGEVAEGFKSLWYMQRNQSASDTEARARVRGFLLEGTKAQIIANMSQYESALASAQGQAAIAKIDEELGKTLIDIYKHADSNAVALRNQALSKWETKVKASLEQQALGLRKQELALKAKEQKPDAIEPLFDPETGTANWYFPPWIQKEERAKARESFEAVDQVNNAMHELRELTRRAKPEFDIIGGTRFAGTDQQRFDALATRIAHGMAKANGERATDQDVADFKKGFRANSWFNQAEAEKVIAATQSQVLNSARTKVRTYAKDLPEELRGHFGKRSEGIPFEASGVDAKATADPPAPSTEEIQAKQASKTAAGTPGNRVLDDEGISAPVRKAHAELAKQHPDIFSEVAKPYEVLEGGEQYKPAPIKAFEASHIELRRLAARARKAGTPDESNVPLGELKRLATTYTSGLDTEDPVAISAAYALATLDEE